MAEKNIVGDIDSNLIMFYKHLKGSDCSIIQQCILPTNAKEFKKVLNQKNKNPCTYLGVNKRSYACRMDKPSFSPSKVPENNPKRGGIEHLQKACNEYQKKLNRATILNEDYRSIVKRYDSKGTLFYLDPPYVDSHHDYGQEKVNPEDVCHLAKSLKGKVMLSYNDHLRVRKACKGLNMKKVQTTYEIQKAQTGKSKRTNELLITNFHLNGGNGHLKD